MWYCAQLIRLILRLRPPSGRGIILPFLANVLFFVPNFCLIHLSRHIPCECVSPSRGFSIPTLRRPELLSIPACRTCYLLTYDHLQTARFPWQCPETGKNATASGLSLKPITVNAVGNLDHRRRCCPLRYCLRRWFPLSTTSLGWAAAGGCRRRNNHVVCVYVVCNHQV